MNLFPILQALIGRTEDTDPLMQLPSKDMYDRVIDPSRLGPRPMMPFQDEFRYGRPTYGGQLPPSYRRELPYWSVPQEWAPWIDAFRNVRGI